MEPLKDISYELSEETRLEDILIWGEVYATHITEQKEIAITDRHDYSKIYMITSIQFYNLLTSDTKS